MKFRVWDIRKKRWLDNHLAEFVLECQNKGELSNLVYCDLEGFALGQDGDLYILDECGNYAYLDKKYYHIVLDFDQ